MKICTPLLPAWHCEEQVWPHASFLPKLPCRKSQEPLLLQNDTAKCHLWEVTASFRTPFLSADREATGSISKWHFWQSHNGDLRKKLHNILQPLFHCTGISAIQRITPSHNCLISKQSSKGPRRSTNLLHIQQFCLYL